MTRIRLGDDCGSGRSVRLDDDFVCCTDDEQVSGDVTVMVTVRERRRDGFTIDGDPRYVWGDVFTGPALLWDTRSELDPVAGVTRVVGNAVVAYNGGQKIVETATVHALGDAYGIVSLGQFPDRIEFELVRIEGTDSGEN